MQFSRKGRKSTGSMDRPGQRPVEDREAEVDFLGLDGDRRGDAEDAEAAAHDAGHHAEVEAFPGDALGELGIGSLGAAPLGGAPRSTDQTSSPPRSGGEEGAPLRSNGVGEVVSTKDE